MAGTKGFASKETAVPRRWGSERLKFDIKQPKMKRSQIPTVKR